MNLKLKHKPKYLISYRIGLQNGDGRKRKGEDGGGGQRKKAKFHGYKEDPFVYFDAATPDPAFTEIQEYFGLEGIDQGMLLTRCRDASKRNNLYFTSKVVQSEASDSEKGLVECLLYLFHG